MDNGNFGHSIWLLGPLISISTWLDKIRLEDISLHSSIVFCFCVHFSRFCRAFRERMLDLNLCKVNMSSGLEPPLSRLFRYQMNVTWVVNVPEHTLYDFGGLSLDRYLKRLMQKEDHCIFEDVTEKYSRWAGICVMSLASGKLTLSYYKRVQPRAIIWAMIKTVLIALILGGLKPPSSDC